MRPAGKSLAAAFVLAVLACGASADDPDWPQWRGPTRDGVAPPQAWSWKWPAEGPTKLWRVNIGQGYGSLIVTGGRVFAFGRVSDKDRARAGDCVTCLDAENGKILWRTKVGEGRGEFAMVTPCTDGERVYSVTHEGNVTASDVRTGETVWQVNIVKEFKTTRGGFHGIANSPLLAGDVLVLSQGVGLYRRTGKLAWQNPDAMAKCHASPVPCPVAGRPGVVLIGQNLVRIDPATGETFWKQEEVQRLGQGYMDPIVLGERVLVLAGSGANRFRFTATSVSIDNKGLFRGPWGYAGAGDMANPVIWRGHLYAPRIASGDRSGMFADNPDLTMSRLECFDLETLEKKWSHPGIACTPVVSDGKLIVQGQYGELRVVEASPEGYVELANARISEPDSGNPAHPFGRASWSTPVLLNGKIYCRFFLGDAYCLDVSRDYPNPDLLAGKRRIVGEVCTVTGKLSARPDDAHAVVVGLLTEDRAEGEAKVYRLCARKHNDNPGHLEKIAALVEKRARVTITGTLMYDDRLSVNVITPVE